MARHGLGLLLLCLAACQPPDGRVRMVVDTDANNELDDQHALALALLSGDHFIVEGVTVNATRTGGPVSAQLEEARRVLALCTLEGQVPLLPGADGAYEDILPTLGRADFDGAAAVRFIIERAHAAGPEGLVLLPIGKLTNVALALALDPTIAPSLRVVWLGSNYPAAGEYNLENDPGAVRAVLASDVSLELVTVRYGEPSGTDAVRVTREEIAARMPGLGPRTPTPVVGRHGESFHTFGDYSVSLFEHIDLVGTPPSRALFDLAAVAIVKAPSWASSRRHPAPALVDTAWEERPEARRSITIWEHFDRDAIVEDLYGTLERPVFAVP